VIILLILKVLYIIGIDYGDKEITNFRIINESKDSLEIQINYSISSVCLPCALLLLPIVLLIPFISLINAYPESEKLVVITICSVIYSLTIIIFLIAAIFIYSKINLIIDKKTRILQINHDFKIFKKKKDDIPFGLIDDINIKEHTYLTRGFMRGTIFYLSFFFSNYKSVRISKSLISSDLRELKEFLIRNIDFEKKEMQLP